MKMKKIKSKMPANKYKACHAIIHTAAAAAGAIGAIPIPVADAIPISAIQIGMIITLGKLFGFTIGKSVAEEIAVVGLAVKGGRFAASNILKSIPIVNVTVGPIVGASTAAVITELMGWIVAYDLYRISAGEDPERIGRAIIGIQDVGKKINAKAERKK